MSLLEHLGRELIAELVPDDWASYAPLIADGLHRFVECLPAHRRAEIANRQVALPLDASISERLVELFRCCPTLHKLGQAVARDRRLPVELRKRLIELEMMAPRTSMEEAVEIVRNELGDLSRTGVELAEELLAEGSVAVVLPFAWKSEEANENVDGVFKILKPGIEQRLAEDLASWIELGGFLDERIEEYGLALAPVKGMLNDVKELLSHEVRLEIEQANIELARTQFEHDGDVIIPRLLPFCTERITAMERLIGVPLAMQPVLSETQRLQIADIVVRSCLAIPMWTRQSNGLFHGDPHAGNWVVLPQRKGGEIRLGLVDWALATGISRENRGFIADFMMAIALGDCQNIIRALSKLGVQLNDAVKLEIVVRDTVRNITNYSLPKFSDTILLLDSIAQNTAVQLPATLLLLRKSVLTLCALLEHFSPHFKLDEAMLSHGLSQLHADWLGRWWAMPWERGIHSHIAHGDLWRLGMSHSWRAALSFANANC